jgi:glycyl-tRNA synthetase beta chain
MFEDFIVVYNRANNLSKGWNKETVDEKLLVDASEKQLYQIISSVRDEVQKALIKEDYQEILKALTGLRPKIDNFFESVMVMVEKEELKANRLSILKTIANLCNSVTDFNKIVQ